MRWYMYIICILIIFAGVISVFYNYEYITADSYIRGSLNIENEFVQEDFKYASNAIVFNKEDDSDDWIYSIYTVAVDSFNGVNYDYTIKINGVTIPNAIVSAGKIEMSVILAFYDTDGELKNSSEVEFSVEFFADRTKIEIIVESFENKSFVENFLRIRGFNITATRNKEVA